MKAKHILITLLMATAVLACNTGSSNQQENTKQDTEKLQQEAWAAMMKVHDEVMPKMADINRISRSLKPFLEEGKLADKTLLEKVNLAIKKLNTADEAMMDWMGEISTLEELNGEKNHEEIMAYLKEETTKIAQVKEDMLSSISFGQEVLDKLNSDDE
jgi:hypothetical protein